MDIEDIARMDLCLRSRGGVETLLELESLFVTADDQMAVNRLKASVQYLMKMADGLPEDVKEQWNARFAKQVRNSVDRAKTKKR